MNRSHIRHRIAVDFTALFLAGTFLVLGSLTLSDHGLTWDEGLGNAYFGQRYAWFLVTFDEKYLDFGRKNFSFYEQKIDFSGSRFRHSPHEFPPFYDTISGLSMEALSYRLGVFDPIEAFHFPTVLLMSGFLLFVYVFWRRRDRPILGLVSLVLIASYPRIWGDMHFNVKDIPEMVFFSVTVLVFADWWINPRIRMAVLTGIVFGMALAIKANALFIPLVAVLGLIPWSLQGRACRRLAHRLSERWRSLVLLLVTGVTSYAVFMTPFWWSEPGRIFHYFAYIFSQGGRVSHFRWNGDPAIQTLITMPEIVLALLLAGTVFSLRRTPDDDGFVPRLLLAWMVVPILRASVPGAVNFDGIRHFQEVVPAICILAALGGIESTKKLLEDSRSTAIVVGCFISLLTITNLAIIHARYNPFQHVYYNQLIGGLTGAHMRYDGATDYWATSYRKGMEWLRENTTEEALIMTPIAGHLVELTSPLYLGERFTPIPPPRLFPVDFSDQPVYVMFITRKGWYRVWANYCSSNIAPIHEIVVAGTPIMQIYRLDDAPGIPFMP